MEHFPGRTAADLYLWVCRHREELAQEQGTLPSPVEAVTDLSRDDEESGAGRVLVSVKRALGSKAKDADLAAEATEAAKRNKDQEGDPPPS
jgi:hypothetical protein